MPHLRFLPRNFAFASTCVSRPSHVLGLDTLRQRAGRCQRQRQRASLHGSRRLGPSAAQRDPSTMQTSHQRESSCSFAPTTLAQLLDDAAPVEGWAGKVLGVSMPSRRGRRVVREASTLPAGSPVTREMITKPSASSVILLPICSPLGPRCVTMHGARSHLAPMTCAKGGGGGSRRGQRRRQEKLGGSTGPQESGRRRRRTSPSLGSNLPTS